MSLFLDMKMTIKKEDLEKTRQQLEGVTKKTAHIFVLQYFEAIDRFVKHEKLGLWYAQISKLEQARPNISLGNATIEKAIQAFLAPYMDVREIDQTNTGTTTSQELPDNHPFSLANPTFHSYLFVQYLAFRFRSPKINRTFKEYRTRFNARHQIIEEYAKQELEGGESMQAGKAAPVLAMKAGYANVKDVAEIINLIREEYEKNPGVFLEKAVPPLYLWKGKEDLENGVLPIPAHAPAFQIQRALAMGEQWQTDMEVGKMWPSFDLTNSKGTVKGTAFMQPSDVEPSILYGSELAKWQAKMLEYAHNHLDDMTADIYDAIMVEWMERAKYPEQMVMITLDQIMEYRALKPKTDEKGRRRGHRREDKEKIDRRVMAMTQVFIKFDEVTVTEEKDGKRRQKKIQAEGPLLQVDVKYSEKRDDGKAEVLGYHCRPGLPIAMGLYGPGRVTARMARMALEMDPYREKYEKRLLRYFAYLWRTRQAKGDYNQGVKVSTMLEVIGLEVEKKNPARTKERLEAALDRLKERGGIADWEYEGGDETIVGTRGWAGKWLDWRVAVEPPAFIMDHYRAKINNPEPKRPALPEGDLRKAIRETRKERGLTIAQAAEEIGISKSMLSMIENGRAKIGPRVRPKIEKWLNQ